MPDFYDTPRDHSSGLSLGLYDDLYLNLNGINRYPRAFKFVPGSEAEPSMTSQESERDGWDFPEAGAIGATDPQGKTFWFQRNQIKIWSKKARSTTLVFQVDSTSNEIQVPDREGTLCLRADIVAEQLIGTKDGVNTTFTTTHNYSQILDVIHEGLADRTFTEDGGNQITYTDTPIPDSGERLKVIYVRS